MNDLYCWLCKSEHPASEGITIFTRSFECSECFAYWEDTWCADCNDRCPYCDTETTPDEILEEEVLVEAVCT